MALIRTPSQTVGPYVAIGFSPLADGDIVSAGAPGALEIVGRLLDGAGAPIPDGAVEIFQADPQGRFAPDAAEGFGGYGRSMTGPDGAFRFRTLKPGSVPLDTGTAQAPHLEVLAFARGLLRSVRTRCYFPDEEAANALDPVLCGIDPSRRATLIATPEAPGRLRFDIHLQGESETVFFGH